MGRQPEDLSAQAQEDGAGRWKSAPALTLLRPCHQPLDRLLARGRSQPWARSRRRRRVHQASEHANALLAQALQKSRQDQFDPRLGFLGWEKGERTNNQGERNPRGVRMMQKTRDTRRKTHPMEPAVELER